MAKKKSARTSARKTTPARKPARKVARKAARKKAPRAKVHAANPLFAPVQGAERREVGHVRLEVGRAGEARVKRMVYPPGFRWSVDMKPAIKTDRCMHAHVGFLARGEIHIEYADGCVVEFKAPQVIAIEPGHDGWVVGDEEYVSLHVLGAGAYAK